jgi:hypothetical protein
MIAWLEEIKPFIPVRAYYGCRGWAIAKFVASERPFDALGLYLGAVLRGCYPWRLTAIVLLQIFLTDRAYRRVADGAISWLGAGFRPTRPLNP